MGAKYKENNEFFPVSGEEVAMAKGAIKF